MLGFPERLAALQPFWGAWYLDAFLGKGSYGEVYRIKKIDSLGQEYFDALKWLWIPQDSEDAARMLNKGYSVEQVKEAYKASVESLRKEILVMKKLSGDSHIVDCRDFDLIPRDNELGWDILIRMELLTPLPAHLSHGMTVGDVINLGIDICDALCTCERENIIHRDIKPDNIFISQGGNYKLGDFGVAKQIEKTAGSMTKAGTPLYMAPEVYGGVAKANHSVDIYSLGLVLHELLNRQRMPLIALTDRIPSDDERNIAFAARMKKVPVPPPVDGSIALKKAICKACEFNPKKRFSSANEMKQALQLAKKCTDVNQLLTANPVPGVGVNSRRSNPKQTSVLSMSNYDSSDTVVITDSMREVPSKPEGDILTRIMIGFNQIALIIILLAVIGGGGYLIYTLTQRPPDDGDVIKISAEPPMEAAESHTQIDQQYLSTALNNDDVTVVQTATTAPTSSTIVLEDCPYSAQAFMKMINDGVTLRDTYHYFYTNTPLGSIAAGGDGLTIGLTRDGGVVIDQGDRYYSDCAEWTDVIAVEASNWACYGLNRDGTVLYHEGGSESSTKKVPLWSDIVAIAASDDGVLAGLHSDGTVSLTGIGYFASANQFDVSSWTDIVAVDVGKAFVVGLRIDGTVLVATTSESMYIGDVNLAKWQNIVAIRASGQYDIIGLTNDGILCENGDKSDTSISSCKDIIQISENDLGTVKLALMIDGTVCTESKYLGFDLNAVVSQFHDVVAVDAGSGTSGDWHAVLLRENGEVIVINTNGLDYQRVSSNWTNIRTTTSSQDVLPKTAIPSATETTTATLSPSPTPYVPKACTLQQSALGIDIRWIENENAKEYLLYRSDDGVSYHEIANVDARYGITYRDTSVVPEASYSYCYSVITDAGNSEKSHPSKQIIWTTYSSISNLQVWQDDDFIRTIHIKWDDIVNAEYNVRISFANVDDYDESYLWSGLNVTEHSMAYEYAIPGTTYDITVTEPITGRKIATKITLPKAKKYSEFGARGKGAKLVWVLRSDPKAYAAPWDATQVSFKNGNATKLKDRYNEYSLYLRSDFNYSRKTDNHRVDMFYAIRTPSGRVLYVDTPNCDIDAATSNHTWWWYQDMEELFTGKLSDFENWDIGTYTVEHYIDDGLVNTSTFKITN